jgi:four helix bundle protein
VPSDQRVLRDQLERASLSTVLHIAEGAGRRSRRDKARHYAIARGSAMECAATVDVLRGRGLIGADDASRCRSYYVRVVQMLTRLQQRLG